MRVLHVISDENIGGAGVLLTSLLRHFDRERIESAVAMPEGSALEPRVLALGVPVFRLRYGADRLSPLALWELDTLLSDQRPDLVHTNAAISARVAARRRHIPVVHTRHCCFPPSGIWRVGACRVVGGFFNRRFTDCAIATAEAARENLRALGIPDQRIRVILNGSDPIRKVDELELEKARAAWQIPRRARVVGICARLVPCKGHDVFLEAAQALCQRTLLSPLHFLIVGEGPERERLEQLCREKGLGDVVTFTGFVADMAPVYRLLSVNVNCSTGTETSCLALSEGMSAGVPCVVSQYGGNAAMIGESAAGLLYPAGNAAALADAIEQVLGNRAQIEAMRRAAYERYLQLYTAQGMADRVAEVYESIFANRYGKG